MPRNSPIPESLSANIVPDRSKQQESKRKNMSERKSYYVDIRSNQEADGRLLVVEHDTKAIPFEIRRIFWVRDVIKEPNADSMQRRGLSLFLSLLPEVVMLLLMTGRARLCTDLMILQRGSILMRCCGER